METIFGKGAETMRRKGYKGRTQKRALSKCSQVCRTYSDIQFAYAEVLEKNDDVEEFECNVLLNDLQEGEYMSDFVCKKKNGDLMVRECVERRYLMKPLTVKLLDLSREYWLRHGVTDWGLVIDAEK